MLPCVPRTNLMDGTFPHVIALSKHSYRGRGCANRPNIFIGQFSARAFLPAIQLWVRLGAKTTFTCGVLQVLFLGSYEEMVRVNTARIIAGMANLEGIVKFKAFVQMCRKTMSVDAPTPSSPDSERHIRVPACFRDDVPATRIWIDDSFSEQKIYRNWCGFSGKVAGGPAIKSLVTGDSRTISLESLAALAADALIIFRYCHLCPPGV